VVLHARKHVAPVVAEEIPRVGVNRLAGDAALLVNGRLLAPPDLADRVPLDGPDAAYLCEGQIAAARVSGPRCDEVARLLEGGPLPEGWADGLPRQDLDTVLVRYPWDLVQHNAEQIAADFSRLGLGGRIEGAVHPSAVLDGSDRIHIASGAEVEPGAILLGRRGPIYIGEGSVVMAGAVVEGPMALGPHGSIKILSKMYEGTSTGEYCKIGGEVEACVFQAYSSKQHDGHMGHCYFGEWVNIGADANNSNLKNNYSTVRVTLNGQEIDSGQLFVGATVGDHTKFGISSMLNTGTVIGVGCNLFGSEFPPKYVPSFCWGGAAGFQGHRVDKFLATAERVMARRKRTLTAAHRQMLETVFALTDEERGRVMT
jgi:UDP-N-acetylglucosamine diphosphorylase/glucosamine-1-phosphate N-acetyltransferase